MWGNVGADIVLDLGEPTEVESLEIVSGPTGGPFFIPHGREYFKQAATVADGTTLLGVMPPATTPVLIAAEAKADSKELVDVLHVELAVITSNEEQGRNRRCHCQRTGTAMSRNLRSVCVSFTWR